MADSLKGKGKIEKSFYRFVALSIIMFLLKGFSSSFVSIVTKSIPEDHFA